MKHTISIIIPFYNEGENISFLCEELRRFHSSGLSFSIDVIFVDDGSTDDSVEKLRREARFDFKSRLITLSRNFGSHAAIRAGLTQAKGAYTIFIYADLQDPLETITKIYNLIRTGNDIVWSVRKEVQSGLPEKLFSNAYSFLMRKLVSKGYPSKGFDIVMIGEKVRNHLNAFPESHSSIFLQILTLGFKQASTEHAKIARKHGISKWTLSKKVKLLIDSFVAFSYAPIRFVSIVGVLFFIAGALWTLYVVSRKLLFNDLEIGWPTLISILLLGFGITNIGLSIVAEYLWRTMEFSRKRPVYVIAQNVIINDEKQT